MPFKSEAQRKWMYANHPEMAKRWEAHTPKGTKLPDRVTRSKGAADAASLYGVKEALHALDRLHERTPDLHPDTIEHLQSQADRLEVPEGQYFLPLTDDHGALVGYACFKTVQGYPKHRLVLATVLSAHMKPKGTSLSNVMQQPRFPPMQKAAELLVTEEMLEKMADLVVGPQLPTPPEGYDEKAYNEIQQRFEKLKHLVRKKGVLAGTAHNRIVIPKSVLTEKDLTKALGFIPVTIAIPEAGQDRFQSFRHPDHNFHIHSHGDKWTMHEDAHAAATMLAKKVQGAAAKTKALVQGMPHVNEEGIPGLYYYMKGALGGHKSTAERVHRELPDDVKSEIFSMAPSPTYIAPRDAVFMGKAAAYARFGVKEAVEVGDAEKPQSKQKKLSTKPGKAEKQVDKKHFDKAKSQKPLTREDKLRIIDDQLKQIQESKTLEQRFKQHRLNLDSAPLEFKFDPLTLRLLEKSKNKVTVDPVAYGKKPEQNGWYDLVKRNITVLNADPGTLAHEMGHADFDRSRIGDVLQSRYLYPRIFDAPLASFLTGGAMGIHQGSGGHVSPAALGLSVGLPALMTVPALISEGVASVKGHGLLKDVGASPEELAKYRRDMLKAYGTYLLEGPAAAALTGAVGYAGGRAASKPVVPTAPPMPHAHSFDEFSKVLSELRRRPA